MCSCAATRALWSISAVIILAPWGGKEGFADCTKGIIEAGSPKFGLVAGLITGEFEGRGGIISEILYLGKWLK